MAHWVVHSELTQFAVATTNCSAFSSDEMRQAEMNDI